MFITRVVFKGFKRFIHNNIQELDVVFTSEFQLILGTNGCGKSSLMREMTLFPPHKSLFDKNGYRKIWAKHRGSVYYVHNDYATDKHSIEKDGEILFENLNPTMMAGVIKDLFNIDRTIADIITDKKKFSLMSPNERRDIIMSSSGINTEVGLDILNKLREQKSYCKEYLKNISKRLVTEENNVPSETHVEELNKRKADIIHDLSVLDTIANQAVDNVSEWEMSDKVKRLEQLGKTVAYAFMDTPKELRHIRDDVDVQEVISLAKFQLQQDKEDKQKLGEEIETLKLSLGKSTFSATEEDITKERDTLIAQIEDIKTKSNGFLVESGDVDFIVNSSQEVYESLRDLFTRLPDNSNRYFNKEARDLNIERLLQLNNRLGVYNKSIAGFEHELHLHKNGDKIECPSCAFDFIPGTKLSHTEIEERLKVTNGLVAKLNIEINKEKEYETEIRDYQNLVLEIEKVFRYFSMHQSLIEALKDYNYINNPPSACLGIIENWFTDVKSSPLLNRLNNRVTVLNKELNDIALSDWEKLKADELHLANLTHQYSSFIDSVIAKEKIISNLNDYIQHVNKLRSWINDSDRLEKELENYHNNVLTNFVNKFVFQTRIDLNNELSDIEKEITNISYLKYNLDKIMKEKEITENSIIDIGIIQDELSTRTGLLGEVMDEYILKFITQMNNIIKSVWTYPMEILPCRNKKGDLDWYFPVKIMDGEDSDDINNLSSSQSDIVNHAFKRLIMLTHDLEDFPLFNDELSNTMDDTHRVNAMKMIYDTVINNQCSQMFFISHFAPQHGVFTQAECLVINADNLQTLPENYNAHAKII